MKTNSLLAARVGLDLIEGLFQAALKQADYSSIRDQYIEEIADAMGGYLEGSGAVTSYRNAMSRAAVEFISDAFYAGYEDAGGEDIESEDEEWLTARIEQEVGNVGSLFQSLRGIRSEGDVEDVAADKAEGYARSLDAVYNEGKLRGNKNKMLTFEGDDGEESCDDCQRYKGQRHSAKWWLNHSLIPGQPGNSNFACQGYRCQHFLEDDDGDEFTFH